MSLLHSFENVGKNSSECLRQIFEILSESTETSPLELTRNIAQLIDSEAEFSQLITTARTHQSIYARVLLLRAELGTLDTEILHIIATLNTAHNHLSDIIQDAQTYQNAVNLATNNGIDDSTLLSYAQRVATRSYGTNHF